MKINDLKAELEKQAPEWEWSCNENEYSSPVATDLRTITVSAKNRTAGTQTLPIQVSSYPNAQPVQLAAFICDVLMLRAPLRPADSQTLMVAN